MLDFIFLIDKSDYVFHSLSTYFFDWCVRWNSADLLDIYLHLRSIIVLLREIFIKISGKKGYSLSLSKSIHVDRFTSLQFWRKMV